MPEQDPTLQQQFEQLPDAAPPLGLHTRIKAQARAHVERQQSARAKHRRWTAGLATASCAVLALVLGKQLLQLPPPYLEEQLIQAQPTHSDPVELMPMSSSEAGSSPAAPQLESNRTLKKSLDNKAGAAMVQESRKARAQAPAAQPPSSVAADAVLELASEPVQMLATEELEDEKTPNLEEMLVRLQTLLEQSEKEKALLLAREIEKFFPDHVLD